MNNAENRITFRRRIAKDPHAQNVEDLVDLLLSFFHFHVDGVSVFDSAGNDYVRYLGLATCPVDGFFHASEIGSLFAFFPHQIILNKLVYVGLQRFQREILKLVFQPRDAKSVCKRGVNVETFLGDLPRAFRLEMLECAHVMKFVSEFDDDDPDVLAHCEEHFSDGLRLGCTLVHRFQRPDLRHAFHHVGHRLAEQILDILV